MSKTVIKFAVRGRGRFPVDMLRYDRCWPVENANNIIDHEGLREVTLVSNERYITPGRWASFGWTVVGEEEVR